ncbi:hypothetical protein ABB37_06230 [Leptomonas pyrrhocoris]|uniref:Uncharacterized protein n=1 Tax=Leptomonas pyrrhocoris TaxID=157538 RepID=A0A0M9FYB8_LEPPY|nr:hypothetical protein ABB37_06230 [Leptomonas pyrrhocoris]KPA78630.1 hypothetical protein ABB37_06230 [Leptomonas pyrrhocoris]|eukprot:XP_015657069.1 hypothetical protein ABB37_06230 [Leptomonas pyrrhocoris]
MAAVQRPSPSMEHDDDRRSTSDDSTVLLLPASMQTLLDRYTERTLTPAERTTLARAAPNVRCEALRIFFETNDAATAVEYVLRHGNRGGVSGSASLRHSEKGGSSRSTNSSAAARSMTASTSAPRSSATAAANNGNGNPPETARAALKPLSTNTSNFHTGKSSAAEAKTAIKLVLSPPVVDTDPLPLSGAENTVESPAPTPSKQVSKRPPSLSAGGAGHNNSGSRPRRISAARRGDSMCTYVTVSSMSDGDDEDERYAHEAEEGEDDAESEDMPPTVTLRSRNSRTSLNAAAAVAQVPALALDSVLKPSGEPARDSNVASSSPVVSAPAERPSRKSTTPAAGTAAVAAGPAVPPSAPPPSSARVVIAPSPSPSPAAAAAAAAAAIDVASVTASSQPRISAPPLQRSAEGNESEARKTVAAKPTVAPVAAEAEPAAATTVPLPLSLPQRNAHHPQKTQQQQQHHVAFTDANAIAVLDAYRKNGARPLGDRYDVGLTYTELSWRPSSASPSCAAPSEGSGGNGDGGGGPPKTAMDWAAMVASVRRPHPPAVATTTKPNTPLRERRTGTATAAVVTAGGTLRTPRGSATTAAQRRSAAAEAPMVVVGAGGATPRTPQDDNVPKRASGGSGHRSSNTAKKHAGQPSSQSQPTSQRGSRRKRLTGESDAPTGASPLSSAGAQPTEGFTSPEKQAPNRSANASPMKRGVAWDETTGTYITHPNQRRRQLAAAAAAAAVPAAAPVSAPAAPSITVGAAGTSAAAAPDVLHACFCRNASAVVAAAAPVVEGGALTATTPRPQVLTRTPTATGAAIPSTVTAATAGGASFGRLCSSALHLPNSNNRNSAAASPPPAKEAKAAKTPRTTPAPIVTAARKKHPDNSPPSSSSTDNFLRKKRTVLTSPRPAVASPRSHTAASTATAAAPTAAEYMRLRSGYPAMPVHDVYREAGGTIALQRQATHYPTAAAAAASYSYSAVDTMRRIASAAPAQRRGAAGEPTGGPPPPAACDFDLSPIHSPRTARTPHGRGGMSTRSSDDVAAGSGGRVSARGPQLRRAASGHQLPLSTPPHIHHTNARNAATVPAAQCGVFERLTSNYYTVYASAVALQASVVPSSPRGGPHTGSAVHSARRRPVSASAGGAERRARRGNPYPAMREGWLSIDGKLPAPRKGGADDVAEAAAPVENAFSRTNTSRYVTLAK